MGISGSPAAGFTDSPGAARPFLCCSCLIRCITLPLKTELQNSRQYAYRRPCLETVVPAIWRCAGILTINRIRFQRRLVSLIPDSFQSLSEQPYSQISTSRFFPTLLFVRVYNALDIHIYLSIVQYTIERHSFSQVSAFRSFRYSSFLSFYIELTLVNTKCLPP